MEFHKSSYEGIEYLITYPYNYKQGAKYPVIIFLHGAGGRGTDIEIIKENPYFKEIAEYPEFPFVSIAPQCSGNSWFDIFERLKKLVIHIAKEEYTDTERIYLVGVSMGGYGTWQLAMSLPEIFAAAIPICGGGMYWNASRLVNVPIWAFHGAKDHLVNVDESIRMVNAINDNGGNAKITIYPERMHNSWSDTYSNYAVFEWLLSNINVNAKETIDIYNNSEIYG